MGVVPEQDYMEAKLSRTYKISALQFDRDDLRSFSLHYNNEDDRFEDYRDELDGETTVSYLTLRPCYTMINLIMSNRYFNSKLIATK